MQTIKQAMKSASEELEKAGIEDAGFNVLCMVSELLKCSNSQAVLRQTENAGDVFLKELNEMVKRRIKHEPLQYIIGSWDFLDFTVKVNKDALIPRPETEEVFLAAKKLITDRIIPRFGETFNFADIGTGTGVLGIALARSFPRSVGCLSDISYSALNLAKENASRLIPNPIGRIKFEIQDLIDSSASQTTDVFISNPPYIKANDIKDLMPEVKDYEPILALDGGCNGLSLISKLVYKAKDALKPGGLLIFEHGDGQQKEILNLFEKEYWSEAAGKKDYAGRERYVYAFLKD